MLETSSDASTKYYFAQNLTEGLNILSKQIISFDQTNVECRISIIMNYMGNMAQCRMNSHQIKACNGIESLMQILSDLKQNLNLSSDDNNDTKGEMTFIEVRHHTQELTKQEERLWMLAHVCLGALRDLACGDGGNRLLIGTFKSQSADYQYLNGIDIISSYIRLFHSSHHIVKWFDSCPIQLRVLTNALGVVRNITHSTPYNCQAFYNSSMVDCFIDLLSTACMIGSHDESFNKSKGKLPDASFPHREACYRLAGSLINMAERCSDVAYRCAFDEQLIWILIESWGGTREKLIDSSKKKSGFPVLHLGLTAILNERLAIQIPGSFHREISNDLDRTIQIILEREGTRKKSARQMERMRRNNI